MLLLISLIAASPAIVAVDANAIPATVQTVAPKTEKKVCRTTQRTGTRIGSVRVCTTAKQDKQVAAEQADNALQFRKEAANPINR